MTHSHMQTIRAVDETLVQDMTEVLCATIPTHRISEMGMISALSDLMPLSTGADSRAIWLLKTQPLSVLKIGRADVVELEIDFFRKAEEVAVTVFPRLEAYGRLGADAWYLMEAGVPNSGEAVLFETEQKDRLQPDWQDRLVAILAPVSEMYHKTVVPGTCAVSDYHYHERIPMLFQRDDFFETARSFGVPMPVATLGDTLVRLNGHDMPSLGEMLQRVAKSMPQPTVDAVSMIHGDLHLKNMVRREAGEGFLFLDPRLQWDQMPVSHFAYGDPVYDMATMLHSVGGMTTILQSIADGSSEMLVHHDVSSNRIMIDLAPEMTQLITAVIRGFPGIGDILLPAVTRGDTYRLRLFTGAANATLGWLKYANAVGNKSAWWLIFALGLLYLAEASEQAGKDA